MYVSIIIKSLLSFYERNYGAQRAKDWRKLFVFRTTIISTIGVQNSGNWQICTRDGRMRHTTLVMSNHVTNHKPIRRNIFPWIINYMSHTESLCAFNDTSKTAPPPITPRTSTSTKLWSRIYYYYYFHCAIYFILSQICFLTCLQTKCVGKTNFLKNQKQSLKTAKNRKYSGADKMPIFVNKNQKCLRVAEKLFSRKYSARKHRLHILSTNRWFAQMIFLCQKYSLAENELFLCAFWMNHSYWFNPAPTVDNCTKNSHVVQSLVENLATILRWTAKFRGFFFLSLGASEKYIFCF